MSAAPSDDIAWDNLWRELWFAPQGEKQRAMLAILIGVGERGVSSLDLADELYNDDNVHAVMYRSLNVSVSQLRARLRPFGWTIVNTTPRGAGARQPYARWRLEKVRPPTT